MENNGSYITWIGKMLSPTPRTGFLAIDLFAGCGGLSLGFEAAGIKTIGYEINEDCCNTYRNNLLSECHQVFLEKGVTFPNVPIVIGGPPCQPFSRIGKRGGRKDARNGFPVFIEAIRKIQPEIWVCENVKGLQDTNAEYFSAIISELKSLGYVVDCRTIRMAEYGVPQRRERMIIVGHHGWFQFPARSVNVVTAGEALGNLAFEVPEDAEFLTPSMDKYIASYEAASHCARPRDLHLDQPARTLTCRNLAGATSDMQRIRLPDGRRRRLTVREAARLQGFPDWFIFSGSKESQFNQIGNAVPPIFSYQLAQQVLVYLQGGHVMSYQKLPTLDTKNYHKKSPEVQALIQQAIQIISCLGIPTDDLTDRAKEKMAMAFLAVADVSQLHMWGQAKDDTDERALITRQIIDYENTFYGEHISSGSYDDVRRKDLLRLLLAGVVVNSKPAANNNNPTRGYQISREYAPIIRKYGEPDWFEQVIAFNHLHPTYEERLACKRELPKMTVTYVDGTTFELQEGQHNQLQKDIIEVFLRKFGYNAVILYCGDAAKKHIILEEAALKRYGFPDLKHGKLPDIIAYSAEKDWLYIIEAFYSSNPITPERKMELENLLNEEGRKRAIYVTAFEDSATCKSQFMDLAWETEVWVASEPEHMLHRNGSRFLGPYEH